MHPSDAKAITERFESYEKAFKNHSDAISDIYKYLVALKNEKGLDTQHEKIATLELKVKQLEDAYAEILLMGKQ